MNSEKEIISLIARHLPRSNKQVNSLFESDAEILKGPKGYLLFSVDDYSEEDHFRTNNPFNLGWNLTVATLSDIFASGGIPSYYSHSMTINNALWDTAFLKQFTEGIAEVLRQTNTFFIGGDFGTTQNWHYTGIAMGKSFRSLTRKGTAPGEHIFMTGKAGSGNMEAALKLFNAENEIETKFGLRCPEAKLIAKYASCCIDSSDGLINALMTISEINDTGFELNNPNINPLASEVITKFNIPKELLLMGECGEYELIFTLKEKDLLSFLEEASKQKLEFTEIGRVSHAGIKRLETGQAVIDFSNFQLRGRDFKNEQDYIVQLTTYLKSHANKG